ncbi:MAG: hypothetical protein M3550_16075 [Actinomycetota bacterium]|nr:hypothetical protein [Actinomycetota bacterium]
MTERDDPGGAVEPSTSPAPYGDNGFLEDYTAQVPRRAHRLAVLVTSNAAGTDPAHRGQLPATQLAAAHVPLLGEKFAGTPYAEYFLTSES